MQGLWNTAGNRKKVFERVGVQLQHTRYPSNITVEESCIEYASLYAEPADYQKLLEEFGLDRLKKSFVSKLSGGERQKLSVVLASANTCGAVFPSGTAQCHSTSLCDARASYKPICCMVTEPPKATDCPSICSFKYAVASSFVSNSATSYPAASKFCFKIDKSMFLTQKHEMFLS